MSEKYYCPDCDKELSEEKLETLHGCLDCHGTVPSDKLFWLRKKLTKLKSENERLRSALGFYGDIKNYSLHPATSHPDCMHVVGFINEHEPGGRALEALSHKEKE